MLSSKRARDSFMTAQNNMTIRSADTQALTQTASTSQPGKRHKDGGASPTALNDMATTIRTANDEGANVKNGFQVQPFAKTQSGFNTASKFASTHILYNYFALDS